MKTYKSLRMVRMEHLNHHHTLYAGQGTEWMVEAAFIATTLEHGNKSEVRYRNTHEFSFSKAVEPGDIVCYESTVVRTGKTSVTMHIALKNAHTNDLHAEGYVTFVIVGEYSETPLVHGIVLDETTDPQELKWREKAQSFFAK